MLFTSQRSVTAALRQIAARPGCRSYALSRFTTPRTGVSRARRIPSARVSGSSEPASLTPRSPPPPREDTPSGEESLLWHASQRPPNSNAADGLKKLLLGSNTLVIERQIEMLNIFVGFEQSNKYSISNEAGEPVGFIAEEPKGFLALLARQAFATHRPFRAVIMDLEGTPVLWVRRPFAWINSRMFVQRLNDVTAYTSAGEPILDTFAEVQQIWHPWRRRYDLFIREGLRRILSTASELQPEPEPSTYSQFAKVDSGFLAWNFRLLGRNGEDLAHIGRAFRGFGREIFTDTGQYSITFGPVVTENIEQIKSHSRDLTLEERALILALAVNIDFDYFSRHSGPGSGGLMGMSHWD